MVRSSLNWWIPCTWATVTSLERGCGRARNYTWPDKAFIPTVTDLLCESWFDGPLFLSIKKKTNVPLFFGSYFLLIMHVFHHTLNPHPFWCHTFYFLFFFFMFFFNSTLHSCMESATSNPWNFQRGLTRVLEEEIVEQWLSSVKRVPGSVK